MEELLNFAKKLNPRLEEIYSIYKNPHDLIGKVVYANRSGFSCGSEGGTEMIIDHITEDWVRFKPTEENLTDSIGWGCKLDDLHFSIRLKKDL